ncbi:MAG: pyridoxal-phosphate dependent enzyme [Thermodesulfobacteriota bacterium]|nr:pyridoxal-phosphate dependent enzyme [Thermodesulfobacteriota bacterium]
MNNQQTTHQNGELVSLIDEATSQSPIVAPELEAQTHIAKDKNQPLEIRLEAFEDIIDSEIGDTPLTRARNIERELGLRQIYLKFEGGNPTGTQKDRIAFAQAMDALRRGFDGITVATCGNYGVAMAIGASMAGLQCIVYIPESSHTKRIKEMTHYGAQIIRTPGDYETSVNASREFAEAHEIYDANPGGKNTAIQLKTYGEIAYEIYDELRDAPSVVAVPVSNGTTIAGIYRGFLSLFRRGKTSRMPSMVAGSSHGKNPIIRAFIKNSTLCKDLDPKQIHETAINEPLINWNSIDGNLALEAIRNTNGWASYGSDKSMTAYSRLIRDKEGLNALPASTVGLISLIERHSKHKLQSDRYVVIITGRKQ